MHRATRQGGGIFLEPGALANLQNLHLSNNWAASAGGGVYAAPLTTASSERRRRERKEKK